MKKIRWVLAHEPIELFQRAVRHFTELLDKRLPDRFFVECMTLTEYSQKYRNGQPVTKAEILGLMETGDIEMSQMYTTWLAEFYNPDFNVLDLPFIFRGHDHAQRVLEGDVGRALLASLGTKTNIKGLAFTYSGGFRIIPATFGVNRFEDFEGKKIRSNRSPVAYDTLSSIGADPVKMELEDIAGAVSRGEILGGESTYPRFFGMGQNKVCTAINDTGHSLFLTSILANTDFWNSLSAVERTVIWGCAYDAASYERQISIDDVQATIDRCFEEGIQVYHLSPDDKAKFQALSAPVYDKYNDVFSNRDIVRNIRNA
jgi:TRAP-type C4-dicarboxylate transport system substrate-binding protein